MLGPLSVGLNMVLHISKPYGFGFGTNAQTQEPLGLVWKLVQFHVHITHAPRLHMVFIWRFMKIKAMDAQVQLIKTHQLPIKFAYN